VALVAGAMDDGIAFVAAPEIGATYRSGRSEPVASHLVTLGDLPDLARACAPRPVWVSGAADPNAWPGGAREAQGMWEWLVTAAGCESR